MKEVARCEALASKAVELLREMRSRGIRPNELTYKPIMSWLPSRGRDAQFQELKQLMAEDGVAFNGDLKNAERLYIKAKKENNNIASSLDGETSDISEEHNTCIHSCNLELSLQNCVVTVVVIFWFEKHDY